MNESEHAHVYPVRRRSLGWHLVWLLPLLLVGFLLPGLWPGIAYVAPHQLAYAAVMPGMSNWRVEGLLGPTIVKTRYGGEHFDTWIGHYPRAVQRRASQLWLWGGMQQRRPYAGWSAEVVFDGAGLVLDKRLSFQYFD